MRVLLDVNGDGDGDGDGDGIDRELFSCVNFGLYCIDIPSSFRQYYNRSSSAGSV